MIEPSKATKGRRMSKKTRKKTLKKSSKTSAGKAVRARSAKSNKTPAAKKRAKPASKPASRPAAKSIPGSSQRPKKIAKTAVGAPAKTGIKTAAPKVSHQGPLKPLKSQAPADAGRPVAPESSTAAAAKPKPSALKTAKTSTEKTSTEKPATENIRAGNPTAGKPLPETTSALPGGHAALTEGMKAPAFRLPRDGGETVSLADFAGRKLVLFFYPRANTPGCTKEAIDFTRLAGAFAESRTAVLGVSADPLKAQEAFRDKHELAIPLISDEQHEMLEAYGVWGEKSMYGKTFLGVLRTTVLIGADGRIVRIWRHVKVDGHADDVLATATAA
jgi:thioredoxin-dependent peroxiredoxin